MDLILWRHADAEDWVEGCDDLERALTPRGLKQAALKPIHGVEKVLRFLVGITAKTGVRFSGVTQDDTGSTSYEPSRWYTRMRTGRRILTASISIAVGTSRRGPSCAR